MSDNWVVQNLENALETWNSKLSEIWQLLTTSPQQFKGGSIWSVMVNINGAVQANRAITLDTDIHFKFITALDMEDKHHTLKPPKPWRACQSSKRKRLLPLTSGSETLRIFSKGI